MKLADKTQIAYVITRDGEDGSVIPCAVFAHYEDATNTVEAYNQKFKDDGITGFVFKLHMTAFWD